MKAKQPAKKGLRISLIISIVLLCALIISIPFLSAGNEEKKFQELSKVMKVTYNALQGIDSSSSWRYKESCSDVYTGDFPTGDIVCSISISLQSTVTSAKQMASLHQSYFSAIRDTQLYVVTERLEKIPSGTFGKSFVVSAAEAQFEITSIPTASCRYTLALGQRSELSTNFSLGLPIDGKKGTMLTTYTCSDSAKEFWFTKSS